MEIITVNRVIPLLFYVALYAVLIGAAEYGTPFVYNVSESMTDLELFRNANTFACGSSVVCNSNNSEYLRNSRCYKCRCQCDEQCSFFGDCCVDIVEPYTKPPLTWACVRILTMGVTKTVLMIQSCPRGLDSVEYEDVRRCLEANITHPEEIIPVTDMLTNITYRNQFCARCNGLTNFEFWQLDVECPPDVIDVTKSKEEIWLDVSENRICTISDHPPKGLTLRPCIWTDVSSCNTNVSIIPVIQRLCQNGYGPRIQIYDTYYHNVFCAMCNGVDIDQMCIYYELRYAMVDDSIGGLKVLLNFNPKPRRDKLKTVDELALEFKCANETYDPIMEKCSPVLCAPRWYYSDSTCKPLFSSASGLGYGLDLLVLTSHGLNDSEIILAEWEFEKKVKTYFEDTFQIATMNGYFRKIPANSSLTMIVSSNDELFFGFFISLQLATNPPTHQDTVEQRLRALANLSYDISLNNHSIHLDVQSLTSCGGKLEDLVKTGDLENEGIFIQSKYFCFVVGCPTDYPPLFEFLDCPFIKINLSSIYHNYDARNSTILINNKTLQLRPESHTYCNGVMQVCVHYLKEIQKQMLSDVHIGGDSTMATVSLVCISLSLVCLFITLVIFCIIPQLRSLPGKNTMALMVHLFCAQLLFQAGINATENVKICQALSILVHYFWLTSFAWMAVCAYHMNSTFSNVSAMRSSRSHMKTLTKFTVFSHVVALTCVLTCATYHLVLSGGHETGYGGSICFLADPMDIGIFFAVPLGLILLFNFFCFVKTIRAIRSVPDMTSVSNQSNKNHVDVYFRLSVLLGFTWLFGFIAAGLQNDVFWYIFVILNGLQGMFISLAYCGKKRTLQMLRSRFSKPSELSVLSITQSSSLNDDSNSNPTKVQPTETNFRK